jgi:hypothetical protein
VIDKDGVFLDHIEDFLHDEWMEGNVTNEFRDHFIKIIFEVRDWL